LAIGAVVGPTPHTVRTYGTARILLAVACVLLAFSAAAGTERYDYDPLGRLIRYVDSDGQVTEYIYDAAGNLLEVRRAGTAQQLAPTIQSVTPAATRAGETIQVLVTGANLIGARLISPDSRITVGRVQATATTLGFAAAAAADAPVGTHAFTLTNGGGVASFAFSITPPLPRLQASPNPLALPPDGVERQLSIRLSNADTIAHAISLASSDSSVLSVAPPSLLFAPGVTEAFATIRGVAAGNATLGLTSPTLDALLVPVFVTAEFAGINTSHAPQVGAILLPGVQPNLRLIDPLLSSNVGTLRPPYVDGVLPKVLIVGSGPTELIVTGAGLQGVTGVSIVPATGLILGTVSVEPSGTAVRMPVTVAPDAAPTVRQIVLAGSEAPYRAATAGADRLLITLPRPEIASIEPLAAVPGSSGLPFIVRGRNLQGAGQVVFTPADGIVAGASPTVSGDGTRLTTTIDVSLGAALGDRIVTVTTPGGVSEGAASPANTFRVVNQLVETVTPVAAPEVGVDKQFDTQPVSQDLGLGSPHVGVALGATVLSMSPAAGAIGSSVDLTLSGTGLSGVTDVQFIPVDGLAVDPPVPTADGTAVSVRVGIAENAPQTLRGVRVLAGAASVPFSSPHSPLFLVSPPQPRVDSIAPIYLEMGAPAVTLTVRGANFQSASRVRVVPDDGLSVSVPPQVDAAGTQATVTISAAAGSAPGARTIVMVTPGGESAPDATPANTLTLVSTVGPIFAPIVAPDVGAVKEAPAQPVETPIGPVVAPEVGARLEETLAPVETPIFLASPDTGVALGATATSVQAPPLVPGASGTLIVSGLNLPAITSIALNPAQGMALGIPLVNPEGTQVTVSFAVATDATRGPREVVLTAGNERVEFSAARDTRIYVAAGAPIIDSLTPIVAAQGSVVELTIRGQNLHAASAVLATPPDGIEFEPWALVNAAGTELVLRLHIAPSAPLGARVIRVVTPGGVSASTASPANTFTVIPP
jgi:YD repeat-containing protein